MLTDLPAIDYTNKDYQSLRTALLELARYRLPEWTDHGPADLGVLLVDLFSYMGDVVLYYQDRIANEHFLGTAQERRSIMHLLRLIGYELRQPVPASADLELLFLPPGGPAVITIPQGARFRSTYPTTAPQDFEYLGEDLSVNLNSDQVVATDTGLLAYQLPVRQSRALPTEVIGSSTGEANQRFPLAQRPAIRDSLVVEVDEGAGWVRWDRRNSLLYQLDADGRVTLSAPDARDCVVDYDEGGVAWVAFGDGVYGRRPPVGVNNIRASYRIGGGRIGNVPAGTISEAVTAITNLDAVHNPAAAAGGEDAEGNAEAVRFGPQAFRSGDRAVTDEDVVALAHQAGGVAKARARALGWNRIELYIAAAGEGCGPVPEDLRRRLLAFFEDRRMAGTFLTIRDPTCVAIDIEASIAVDPHYDSASVRQQVDDALHGLLAYEAVDFGQVLLQAEAQALAEAVPGVVLVAISHFCRQDQTVDTSSWDADLVGADLPAFNSLPKFLQDALLAQEVCGGRIELGAFEIAVAGTITVAATVATP